MGGIITPHVMIETGDAPLFFFGGPMRHAPQWQDEGMEYLSRKAPDAFLVTPRPIKSSMLLGRVLNGMHDQKRSQRPWENHYMRRAFIMKADTTPQGRRRCLIFYLPRPVEPIGNKGYANTSRLELGQTIAWMEANREYNLGLQLNVVFGRDPDFPDIGPIETDLRERAGNPPIYDTLKQTCDAALEIANMS